MNAFSHRSCRLSTGARYAIAALLVLGLAACSGIGPKTIPRDRVEYVEALRESWKRQVLLNIVALRYDEAPSFIEVVSVINQYSVEGSAQLDANWGSIVSSTGSAGISGRWSDRPTITFSPVTGERYVRTMLTPMPPESAVAMVEAGWAADFVLGLTVRSINGINSPSMGAITGSGTADSEFPEVLAILRRIQLAGAMSLRLGEHGEAHLLFRAPAEAREREDRERLAALLGLDPERRDLRIVYGPVANAPDEIAFLTRSMIDILIELSGRVDVPPEDVAEGRTTPDPVRPPGAESLPISSVRIRWSDHKPDDAFAAVRYHDRWFWIANTDLPSKRALSFLLVLLSLSETGGEHSAPLVTVGAGG